MPRIQMGHVAHTMSYPISNLDESWHNRGMSPVVYYFLFVHVSCVCAAGAYMYIFQVSSFGLCVFVRVCECVHACKCVCLHEQFVCFSIEKKNCLLFRMMAVFVYTHTYVCCVCVQMHAVDVFYKYKSAFHSECFLSFCRNTKHTCC